MDNQPDFKLRKTLMKQVMLEFFERIIEIRENSDEREQLQNFFTFIIGQKKYFLHSQLIKLNTALLELERKNQ